MSQQSHNEPSDGNRDADVNPSQASSSGIDMNYEDVSSQGTNHESGKRCEGASPSGALEKALDNFRDKFPDFITPTNATDWQQLFESTVFKSRKYAISYEEHLWTWIQLIITARQLNIDEDSVVSCYVNALSMLPIKIFETDTTWAVLINSIYAQMITGEISETDAARVLQAAENKFIFSPKHARVYWNTRLKNEKQFMKKTEKPLPEQQRKIVDLLMIRFSNPYLDMEEDYSEFTRWALDVNLNKDLKLEVQQAFLKHSKLRIMSHLNRIMDEALEKTKESKHHILFDNWIDSMCNEEYPIYDKVEIICEEIIAAEPDSLCYYWMFLNALSSTKFDGIFKREKKIYEVIQRGYRLGKTSCEGMDQRFLENCLIIASKILCVEKVLELVEAALTNAHFAITNNSTRWYASSRGVIITISNLIHKECLEWGSFESYFKKVISPCTMDFFKSSVVPPELADITGYETLYLELVRLWVVCQESYYQLPWEKTLQLWTNIFLSNANPIMLVGYVDFVKKRGSPKEGLEATVFALGQMVNIESSEVPSKYETRRCYVKLMQDYFEIISVTGNADGQVTSSKEFQRKLNFYMYQYANEFRDLMTPGRTINGFSPFSESEKPSQESVSTRDPNFSDNSIVNRLQSLQVDPDNDKYEFKSNNSGSTKVFLSNMDYLATKEDVINAFRDRGFEPIEVDIFTSQEGGCLGFAVVTFDTKEVAEVAVKLCDKFLVCGRVTFVSANNRWPRNKSIQKPFGQKKSSPSQPTLITLYNLDAEWKDKDKITNKLARYGHVKSVDIEEYEDSSFFIRVEFYMPEDARNASDQIIQRQIFGDSAQCRIGYPSNKRQIKEKSGKEMKMKKKFKKSSERSEMEVSHGSNLETSPLRLADTGETSQQVGPQIGPQMPLDLIKETPKPKQKPTRSFNLLPVQAFKNDQPRVKKRSNMKARLDYFGGSSSATSTASSNDFPVKNILNMSDEADLDIGASSQSSTSSADSPSPQKKIMRMTTDKNIKQLLDPISEKDNTPNGDETPAPELEFATNCHMEEEEADTNAKPSLTNKDFQRLFKNN